jgi:putative transposase
LTRNERITLIEREDAELPITIQAELLGLNRSSLYYRPIPPSQEEISLKHRIDEIYTEYPFFGSRRITAMLHREGEKVHRNTVRKYMREMGLSAIYPGKRNLQHRVFPYLLRNLTIDSPNHVWGVDITYIRMSRGWMYLVAILDWFSRYVISWELDQTLELPFVIEAVERALKQSQPQIINSDQGSHFTSSRYIERFQSQNVQISMDGRGRALDNIFTERLWRSVKYEEVYLHDYQSPRETRTRITQYLSFYNYKRPHQSLDYKTPSEVYYGG